MIVHKEIPSYHQTECGKMSVWAAIQDDHALATKDYYVTCPECLKAMQKEPEQQTPKHYQQSPNAVWQFCEDTNLSFLESCVVKRVFRHAQKDGAKDLDKAIDELRKLKEHRYGSNP